MTSNKRAKDGRFSGGKELPPKPPQKSRDEHGRWIKSERVVSSKPYSKAVRELFDAREGGMPEHWDRENLTEAQALAMVHFSQARSGNVQIGMVIIDRAEGKVPQAAEDREAAVKAGEGIKLLAGLLGIDMSRVVDTEVVQEPAALPPAEGGNGNTEDSHAADGDNRGGDDRDNDGNDLQGADVDVPGGGLPLHDPDPLRDE